jgi:hypothetical protein
MDNHLVYEKKRGVEWISRMTQTMSGIEKFKLHSPMRQIAKLKSVKLPKIYLRHGEYDGTVPYESSKRMAPGGKDPPKGAKRLNES